MQYSLDIIMEADKFNFSTENGKLVVCTPYHYDDPISKACTKEIKQIIENQSTVYVSLFMFKKLLSICSN